MGASTFTLVSWDTSPALLSWFPWHYQLATSSTKIDVLGRLLCRFNGTTNMFLNSTSESICVDNNVLSIVTSKTCVVALPLVEHIAAFFFGCTCVRGGHGSGLAFFSYQASPSHPQEPYLLCNNNEHTTHCSTDQQDQKDHNCLGQQHHLKYQYHASGRLDTSN